MVKLGTRWIIDASPINMQCMVLFPRPSLFFGTGPGREAKTGEEGNAEYEQFGNHDQFASMTPVLGEFQVQHVMAMRDRGHQLQ